SADDFEIVYQIDSFEKIGFDYSIFPARPTKLFYACSQTYPNYCVLLAEGFYDNSKPEDRCKSSRPRTNFIGELLWTVGNEATNVYCFAENNLEIGKDAVVSAGASIIKEISPDTFRRIMLLKPTTKNIFKAGSLFRRVSTKQYLP